MSPFRFPRKHERKLDQKEVSPAGSDRGRHPVASERARAPVRILRQPDAANLAPDSCVGERPLLRHRVRPEGEGMTDVKKTLAESCLSGTRWVSMLEAALS